VETRTIAMLALVLVVVVFVLLAVHVVIPTPPAHAQNALYARVQRALGHAAPTPADGTTSTPADASMAGAAS